MSSFAIGRIPILTSENIAIKIKPCIAKVNAVISHIFVETILVLNDLREYKNVVYFNTMLGGVVVFLGIFIIIPAVGIWSLAPCITAVAIEIVALNLLIKKSFSLLLKLTDTTSNVNTLRRIVLCLGTIIQSQKTTEVMKEQALNKLWELTDNSNERVLACISYILVDITTSKSNPKQKEAILEKLSDLNEAILTMFIVTLQTEITSQNKDEAKKKRVLDVFEQCTSINLNFGIQKHLIVVMKQIILFPNVSKEQKIRVLAQILEYAQRLSTQEDSVHEELSPAKFAGFVLSMIITSEIDLDQKEVILDKMPDLSRATRLAFIANLQHIAVCLNLMGTTRETASDMLLQLIDRGLDSLSLGIILKFLTKIIMSENASMNTKNRIFDKLQSIDRNINPDFLTVIGSELSKIEQSPDVPIIIKERAQLELRQLHARIQASFLSCSQEATLYHGWRGLF